MNIIPAIKSLCALDFPKAHSATFLKNKKYLPEHLERIQKNPDLFKTIILFVEDGENSHTSIYKNLSAEQKKTLEEFHQELIPHPDIDFLMSELTTRIASEYLSDKNHYVDGRQMGNNCQISPYANIAQGVFIGENVIVEKNVQIMPHCTILHDVHLRENTIIYPNVTIYPRVQIGANCIIHGNTVIGADGFGFHFKNGTHHKIASLGGVIIEDNVEIGANSAVDSGTLSPTLIGQGTKIDNFVQVGHNVQIGKHVILCGHVAIGGSSKIGDYCVFGGKSGMGPQMVLGNYCQVAGGALVNCDWPANTQLGGHPARPIKEWMRGLAYLRTQSLKKSST